LPHELGVIHAKTQGATNALGRQDLTSLQDDRVTSDLGTALLYMHARRQGGTNHQVVCVHVAIFQLDHCIGSGGQWRTGHNADGLVRR
jgi:hypothetical protein